jgi:hypothetical protein
MALVNVSAGTVCGSSAEFEGHWNARAAAVTKSAA